MEHLTAPWADVFAHPFPVAILAAYLLAAALLTWRSIAIIAQQASSKSRTARSSSSSSSSVLSGRPLVFALLAAASLGTTQYHLFSFFAQSYREWEEDQLAGAGAGAGAGALRLGSWLRDTKLFEQAWRSAMATESRFWWTQQIFCFAAGWSVLLGTEAKRRQVSRAWIFMLLSQIVAISFASNLFFLTLALSPASAAATSSKAAAPRISGSYFWYLKIVVVTTFACVGAIPYVRGRPAFLVALGLPHVLVFVPVLLPQGKAGQSPKKGGKSRSSAPKQKQQEQQKQHGPGGTYALILVLAAVVQGFTTFVITDEGGGGLASIREAFYEHPAVTSAGWDVIMCWISYGAWCLLEE